MLDLLVSEKILKETHELNCLFNNSSPYKYIAIDNFFSNEFIAELINSFPLGGPEYDKFCLEDGGAVGSNYANSDSSSFPGPFQTLNKLAKSPDFVELISSITGIHDLNFDPEYIGGGIRESKKRNFLPIHLDFNYHPQTLLHRRLNLLFYLNSDWSPTWGGSIQVHSDPDLNPSSSLVAEYLPLANRVFIFETSEISWHGFSRLNCPENIGRKAFSLYYYTHSRPEGEVPQRNTEYVEPWLPSKYESGYTLTNSDIADLCELLKRRDDRIKMLYELRRSFDQKYSHLWSEYEYYLKKYQDHSL